MLSSFKSDWPSWLQPWLRVRRCHFPACNQWRSVLSCDETDSDVPAPKQRPGATSWAHEHQPAGPMQRAARVRQRCEGRRQAQSEQQPKLSAPYQNTRDLDVISQLGPHASSSEVQEALQDASKVWLTKPRRITTLLHKAPGRGTVSGILDCMRRHHIEINVWHTNAAAGRFLDMQIWQRAVQLCALMPAAAMLPDVTTAALSTKAFVGSSNWLASLTHLNLMTASRAHISGYTKSFLTPCTERSQWKLSVWFLHKSPVLKLQPDRVSIAEALRACRRGALWEEALRLPLAQSLFTANCYLDVLSSGTKWREVLCTMERMTYMRLGWDKISVNTAINAIPDWQFCLAHFSDFVEQALQPDVVTHGTAIPDAAGQWQKGLSFLCAMSTQGAETNLLVWNCFLNSISVESRWSQASMLLGELPEVSVRGDRISFASGIRASQSALLWQTSLNLGINMASNAIEHDTLSFSALGCASNSWQRAMSVLRTLRGQVRSDTIMQNSHLDAFGKSDWARALDISLYWKASDVRQDEFSLGALLSTCQTRHTWPCALGLLGRVLLLKLSLDAASASDASSHSIAACHML